MEAGIGLDARAGEGRVRVQLASPVDKPVVGRVGRDAGEDPNLVDHRLDCVRRVGVEHEGSQVDPNKKM